MNLLIICLLISTVISHEIFTRTQLRGQHKQYMYRGLDLEIQTIVKNVIERSQWNQTSYTHPYNHHRTILGRFEDVTIIERLRNILVDSNITIVGPKCCDSYCRDNDDSGKCKFITIDW
jgi:hypothetical protein